MPSKILALDTSTEACSVALFNNGEVTESYEVAPRRHNEIILPILETVLAESGASLSDIDLIAFGCGPGSFTGLRIAASVVQGIAYSIDRPVMPVSTLRALAQGAYRECNAHFVLSALDAHMEEIYWGAYQYHDGTMINVIADMVSQPTTTPFPPSEKKDWIGIGSGWDKYANVLANDLLHNWLPNRYPRAQDIATLAMRDYQDNKAVSAEHALPVYLRDNLFRTQ